MHEITDLLYQKCHLKLFVLGLVTEVIFQAPLYIANHVLSATGQLGCKANAASSSRNCILKYCYTIRLSKLLSSALNLRVLLQVQIAQHVQEGRMFVPSLRARGRGNSATNLF